MKKHIHGLVVAFAQALSRLPNYVLVLLFLHLAMPFGYLLSLRTGNGEALGVVIYLVVPWSLCVVILRRSFLFLPLFAVEWMLLLGDAVATLDEESGFGGLLRVASIVCMGLLFCTFASRDLIFPFLARGTRWWRKAPRLYGNSRVKVRAFDGEDIVPAVVENCSITGMSLSMGANAAERDRLMSLKPGTQLSVEATLDGKAVEISCSVVWLKQQGPLIALGLGTTDALRMEQLIASMARPASSSAAMRHLNGLWVKSHTRRAALSLFFLSVSGSFWVPACGDFPPRSRLVVKASQGPDAPATEEVSGVAAVEEPIIEEDGVNTAKKKTPRSPDVKGPPILSRNPQVLPTVYAQTLTTVAFRVPKEMVEGAESVSLSSNKRDDPFFENVDLSALRSLKGPFSAKPLGDGSLLFEFYPPSAEETAPFDYGDNKLTLSIAHAAGDFEVGLIVHLEDFDALGLTLLASTGDEGWIADFGQTWTAPKGGAPTTEAMTTTLFNMIR